MRIIPVYGAIMLTLGMLCWAQKAEASHAMGADLSYRCLGNNNYEITLKFYRDCAGIPAPTSASINISSASCGISTSMNLTMDLTNSGYEVSPLCPSQIIYSSCHNGPLPGVQVYTYKGTFHFPSQCNDWVISWTHCCRNAAITNLQNPSSQSMYIEAHLDNTNGLCDNSPIFTELPVPFICANQLYNYNHGVVEPDGDSLYFTMINPMTAGGLPIAHNVGAGYSLLNPILTTTPFTFSSSTGQFSFTANGVQVCVVTILVQEFRNGQLIGSTMRDIQVVIINCTNDIPYTNYIQNLTGGGVQVDSLTIKACPGETIDFDVIGHDNNALDSVFLSSNITQVLNGATYTVSGNNPTTGHFNWSPSLADTGYHFFIVTVKDNACPMVGQQTYAFIIIVDQTIKTSGDVKYCVAGGPQKLSVYGGSHFTWTPTTGIVGAAPDSSWILVAPTQSTVYHVLSNCNVDDSITVTVVPSFSHSISPGDTICKFESSQILVWADSSNAPYTWQWNPSDSLDTPNGPNPMATPLTTTTYKIKITSKDGCVVRDSTTIVVQGEVPRIAIKSPGTFVCPEDSLPLEVFSTPGECAPNTGTCSGNSITKSIGAGTGSTGLPTPFEGAFEDSRMQILYRAGELHSAGLEGGTITALAFKVANKMSSLPYNNFTISIGCTDMDTLPKQFTSGLYPVFGPKTISTTSGWNNFGLDLPYDWDGYSNLLIEICFDNSAWSDDDDVYFTPTTYNSVVYDFFDNTLGCSLVNATQSADRPDMRFTVCSKTLAGININWTPAYGLSDPNSPNPVVSGITAPVHYTVTADNNGCIGTADIIIDVDTTKISVTPDTFLCNPAPVQLNAQAFGYPPPLSLNCGTNGTLVSGTPVTYELGGGTISSPASMFPGNSEDMQFQILYTAQELQALGMTSGVITEYAFELATKNSSVPVENFSIYMGCTSDNTLNVFSWESAPYLVYSNTAYNTVSGWNTFTLTNPFDWDGSSNLVVQICWDNPNGSPLNSTDNLKTHSTPFNSMVRNYGTGQSGCNFSTPQFIYNQRVNSRFTITPPPPGSFQFIWAPATGLNDPAVANPLANPANTITYTVSTTSASGCTIRDSVTIAIDNFTPAISTDTAICLGDTARLHASGGVVYQWSPPADLSDPTAASPWASPAVTTIYTVTVTDAAGCSSVLNTTVTVNNLPNADAGQSDTIFIGQSIQLNGSGGMLYLWTPSGSLDNPLVANPMANPLQTTTYTLTVTDANRCTSTDSVTIVVIEEKGIIAPTAFSPNGDGLNDEYRIILTGGLLLDEFTIYNRWGQKIFTTTDPNTGWNGYYKGQLQEIGTYIYLVRAHNYLNEEVSKKGNLTLIR